MQDPADQLRGKANRLSGLNKLEKKLREKLKNGSIEEAELEDQLIAKAAENDKVRKEIREAIAEQV